MISASGGFVNIFSENNKINFRQKQKTGGVTVHTAGLYTLLFCSVVCLYGDYIRPGIPPPMPPPIGGIAGSSDGASVTPASVVRSIADADDAF